MPMLLGDDPRAERHALKTFRRGALTGAIAFSPTVAGACGFIAHWNAVTNVSLLIIGWVIWLTLDFATRKGM